MRVTALLILSTFANGIGNAGELPVSSKEPVVVTAPDQWKSVKDTTKNDFLKAFPFETYDVAPPAGRNALCMISILSKGQADIATRDFLKLDIKGECRPYVPNESEIPKLKPKDLKLKDGFGFYLNFVDPDLVGKPIKKGKYKTATPIMLNLSMNYVIKITLLCDDLQGADYRDMMKIVESIRIKSK